jgi:hypothetical protein
MKARLLAVVMVAALASPAAARPAVAPTHRAAVWTRIWDGFVGFFSSLVERPWTGEHSLPPPPTSTCPTGQ